MIDSNLSGLNLTQTRRPTRCGEASLIKKRSQLEKNIKKGVKIQNQPQLCLTSFYEKKT